MNFSIITLFPDFFSSSFNSSILKRAIENDIININLVNPRDFAPLPHKKVDDSPYGGGAGLVLKVDIIHKAIKAAKKINRGKIIALSPRGKKLDQKTLERLSQEDMILLCGHYEGFDERIYDFCDESISLGDFILTGGEPVALTIIDGVTRLIDGALGNSDSPIFESFSGNRLEAPCYTRPMEYKGKKVPAVLSAGNHKKIQEFNDLQSLLLTLKNRPDLLENGLTDEELKKVESIKRELSDF